MFQMADQLLDLLNRQISLYQKLGKLLDEEQQNLIELDLDRLQKITRIKEETAQDITFLIEPVSNKIKELARNLGLKTEPLPLLALLAEALPEPNSGRLRRSSQDLARIKTDIFRHNQDNQNFIEETLGLITDSLTVLTGVSLTEADQYLPTGERAASKSMGPIKLNREV